MQKQTFLQRPKSYVVCSFLVIKLYDIVRLLYVLICIIKCFFLLKGINIATLYKGSFLDFYFFYIKSLNSGSTIAKLFIKFQFALFNEFVFTNIPYFFYEKSDIILCRKSVFLCHSTLILEKTNFTCFKPSLMRKLTKCAFFKNILCIMTTFFPFTSANFILEKKKNKKNCSMAINY